MLIPNYFCIAVYLYIGKKAILDIKESDPELKKLLVKQKTLKREKRLKSLLAIKSGKFETRQALADFLGIHIRTLERWLVNSKTGGVELMLTDKPKNKTSKIITPEIHKGLSQRVHDSNNPFLGYWDAQNWVEQEYGVAVKGTSKSPLF
jgi:hypothetical protein